MKTLSLLPVAALALAACSPEFDPASKVDRLRVLAIRAEPPEIDPTGTSAADHAALTSLVLRGDALSGPARLVTVLYLACAPLPGDPSPSPCVMLASLRDPTAMLAEVAHASCAAPGPGPSSPPPVAFAGIEACDRACGPATVATVTLPSPGFAIPAGWSFDALPAGAPERILGVEGIVLAFAVDATPDELASGVDPACVAGSLADRLAALWSVRDHVLADKRVQIRGPDASDDVNVNPLLSGIAADGTELIDAQTRASGDLYLTPLLAGAAQNVPQSYTKYDAAGVALEAKTEEWVYSWFSTAGKLEDPHTRAADATDKWTVDAGTQSALVAVVVRDLRGGTDWQVREVAFSP